MKLAFSAARNLLPHQNKEKLIVENIPHTFTIIHNGVAQESSLFTPHSNFHFFPFCRKLSFEMLPLRAGPVPGLETGGAICTPLELLKQNNGRLR